MATSIEQALLDRARPYMLAARARQLVRQEAGKGCRADIADVPVALEPAFQPIFADHGARQGGDEPDWEPQPPPAQQELCRLRIWLSPEQKCDWDRSELFLKQLSRARRRIGLEILGNERAIAFGLLCRRCDVVAVRSAFRGQFERCELSLAEARALDSIPAAAWDHARFLDLFPPPPYSHLLTSPEELKRSPYATLLSALAQLPEHATGLFQVLFAPVRPEHDWHANIQALLDLEFAVKLLGGLPTAQRFAQQAPSGDLHRMATDTQAKAHNDKPLFAAACRLAVLAGGQTSQQMLESLAVACNVFQHGGRPLCLLSEQDYRNHLSGQDVRRMFEMGLTYRPGFLVNSWELTSLVHVPPLSVIEHLRPQLGALETLPPGESLLEGTPLGTCAYAGIDRPACIPAKLRTQHVHLIGRPGMGKSCLLEHMVLHDISCGHGVAVLDPHGPLIQRLLCLIPAQHADRVIYVNPGDPDWVPLWNPLQSGARQSPGRTADDLVRAFKTFVTGWGDRLEHLLRHALYAILHLPGGSLMDVSNLLRKKSPQSEQLRWLAVDLLDSEVARLFWRHDFGRYSSADLAPAQHKLSKLLTSGTVSLMLSQSDTSFDLRGVMDSGKILLVDLSGIGPEVRDILGCLFLSLLHLTALGRASQPTEAQLPFHIYCDEAHRFVTDAIEDLIAETRKFNVSLTLAHQYLSQFTGRKIDALSSVGSTVIFNVDTRDAQHLRKDLQGLVEVDDLITMEVGQAVARIGNHVVRLRTLPPLQLPADHCRDRIRRESHARYYRPVAQVQEDVRQRARTWGAPVGRGRSQEAAPCGNTGVIADPSARAAASGGGESQPERLDYDVF